MQKALIIIGIIVVIGGAGLYATSRMFTVDNINKAQENVQVKIDDARLNAKQASIKALAAGMMGDLGAYYSNEKNTLPYDQNPTVKANIQAKIDALKQKYSGNYQYNIFEEKEGDVAIKVGETESGIYVCVDSKVVKVVDISAQDFAKRTDCSGVALKN